MAGPASNPARRTEPKGGARVNTKRIDKRAGTVGKSNRTSIPARSAIGRDGSGQFRTTARAVTMSGAGTEDKNPPESGRARQDAARGTVHGQPRTDDTSNPFNRNSGR